MRHNNFSVRVFPGHEAPGGYVEIEHGTRYRLRISNHRKERCDARILIDGKEVGIFRVGSHGHLELERPVNDTGHFTAYLPDSAEGRQAQIAGNSQTGLIQVIFTPEVAARPLVTYRIVNESWNNGDPVEYHYASYAEKSATSAIDSGPSFATAAPMAAPPQYEQMGTGLSGHSDQRFIDVPPLNYDYSQQTTISLRLVRAKSGPRPLVSSGNPVPPPVK